MIQKTSAHPEADLSSSLSPELCYLVPPANMSTCSVASLSDSHTQSTSAKMVEEDRFLELSSRHISTAIGVGDGLPITLRNDRYIRVVVEVEAYGHMRVSEGIRWEEETSPRALVADMERVEWRIENIFERPVGIFSSK